MQHNQRATCNAAHPNRTFSFASPACIRLELPAALLSACFWLHEYARGFGLFTFVGQLDFDINQP